MREEVPSAEVKANPSGIVEVGLSYYTPGSMHYERAPHFKRLKLGMRRRLRCAALCRASLRLRRLESNGRWQRVQEGIGKTAGQWHFTLRERFRGRE